MIHSDVLGVPRNEVPLNKAFHSLLDILCGDGEPAETHHFATQSTVDDALATFHYAHD
mgnify:CR=1 FL=1